MTILLGKMMIDPKLIGFFGQRRRMSALDCQTFAHSLPGGSLCGGTRWSPAKVQVTGEGWWGLCLTGLGGFLLFWGDGCQRALKCHKIRACIQSFGFWGVKQSLWNLDCMGLLLVLIEFENLETILWSAAFCQLGQHWIFGLYVLCVG